MSTFVSSWPCGRSNWVDRGGERNSVAGSSNLSSNDEVFEVAGPASGLSCPRAGAVLISVGRRLHLFVPVLLFSSLAFSRLIS